MENQPAAVPATATQAGEVRARWAWTEPGVWTDRMLTALEQGVKGGVWYALMDKVYAPRNLLAAWQKVQDNAGAAGVDRQSVEEFARDATNQLQRLMEQLRKGSFQPQPVRRVWIDKPGTTEQRPLGIPAVRDRVVQTALCHVLTPIWEKEFAEQSYGYRPERGCKDALRRVDELLKAGYTWVVDADLKKFFDTIPHDRLLSEVKERVADGRVLELIAAYLKAKVMDGMQEMQPETGSPQGSSVSPLLSNIYLNPVDHQMAQAGWQMIRYADDFVILCRTREEAEQALALVTDLVEARGLQMHPDKTRIVDATQPGGFDFLGYHFERGKHWPRAASLAKFRDNVRQRTPRSSGQSLKVIAKELNYFLRGWFNYFKHSHRTTFQPLDGLVRRRLRSILRKRQGLRGTSRGRGADHQRWPNLYFAALGLFDLKTAHALASQL
jgi:RNA-directed DNA polymerase